MANNSERDASSYWRDKYLNLLNDFERLEAASNQKHDAMRRGLVITSLLAEGQSRDVDPLLRSLRDSLKPEATGLAVAVDQLSRSIETFDQQKIVQIEVLLGQIRDAANKLLECPFPKTLLKRVRTVRQQASRELESYEGFTEQLQQWVQIVGEIASLPAAESGNKGKGWLKQWFSASKQAENEAEAEAETEKVPELEPAAIASPLVGLTNEDNPFETYAQDISDTLIELLDQLSVPERLQALHTGLRERLADDIHLHNLVSILEDTSSFVLECLEDSQVDIETFLQNLDERLQNIRDLVERASSATKDSAKARDELEGIVREQLSDIRTSLHGSDNIQQLSLSVTEHLALILEAMEHYRIGEEGREAELRTQLQQLQQRLNDMEKEISESREALDEQRRKAMTDTLTGLPNRAAYQTRLIDEYARYHRYQTPLSLVMCDVDYFKKINDSYGHLAGDKVLQLISRSLQKNIREVDFIARYGGEEFVILMPGTNSEQAVLAAEKLRKAIEQSPFNFRKERVFITMSFGVAEFQPNELPDVTFDRADRALYQSKEGGRNTVNVA